MKLFIIKMNEINGFLIRFDKEMFWLDFKWNELVIIFNLMWKQYSSQFYQEWGLGYENMIYLNFSSAIISIQFNLIWIVFTHHFVGFYDLVIKFNLILIGHRLNSFQFDLFSIKPHDWWILRWRLGYRVH